jgi:hypothetical protein
MSLIIYLSVIGWTEHILGFPGWGFPNLFYFKECFEIIKKKKFWN